MGTADALAFAKEYGVRNVVLTDYSVLRGLTSFELVLDREDGTDVSRVARLALTHFIVEAEGSAWGSANSSLSLLFAEGFVKGHRYRPSAILLPEVASVLGIGGTDQKQHDAWALLLSRHYNPATRRLGEVAIKKMRV